ncbi:MAG: hypothetical protein JST59_01155 [Actinobacteria bacterium]|nr:hypothetical protein [Actinomycetota bacterium]
MVSEELRRTITQKLEEYDSDANNFVILDSLAEKKPEFMKSHKTSIPIGENCQAELPLFLGSEIYAVKSQYYNDMLDGLRISCRKEDQTSYTPRLKKFREEMGEERTEEEFAFSCKYYK